VATPTQDPPALVAAGARVRFTDKHALERVRARSEWQAEAWDYYDAIGAVRWAYDQVARLAARSRIGLGWWPERDTPALLPDRPPVEVGADGQPTGRQPESWPDAELIELAQLELDQILDGIGGADDFLSLAALQIGLVGECYIIGRFVRDETTGVVSELWSIHSGDAVTVRGDNVEVRTGPGTNDRFEVSTKVVDDEPEGFYARIWIRHPRYPDRPTTTLRATLGDCEELDLLRKVMRASYRSRISAGVVFVAQELNGRAQLPVSGDGISIVGDVEAGQDFAAEFLASIVDPINDESSDGGVAPWVVPAPSALIANNGAMQHIKFGREITAQDLAEREALDRRIAQGLPLPPEAVTGVSDVNHWTAWQISEDLYRIGVAPVLDVVMLGFTEGVLVPLLEAHGILPEIARTLCVWYDPTDAITRPDPIERIAAAFRDGVINAMAYRRFLPGITEDDAPTGDEIAGRILSGRGILTAEATLALITAFGGPSITPVPATTEAVDTEGGTTTDDGSSTPDETGPGIPDTDEGLIASAADDSARLGRQLGEIERSLFRALLVAADAAVARIVDRVGAQARTRTQRDPSLTASIAGLANRDVPRRLGRQLVTQLGLVAALGADDAEQIRAGFDDFRVLYLRLVGDATAQATELLAAMAATPEQTAAVLRIVSTWPEQVEASATFVVDLLMSDTMAALFDDVELNADQLGEIDQALRVRPDTLRRAISVAGGADPTDLVPDIGGLTGGTTATAAAAEAGLVRDGYVWVYGAGTRDAPFPPHRARDGFIFDDFEDPVLATTAGYSWVGAFFHPGDHAYCQCSAEVRFVPRSVVDARRAAS
jgi:hypothetical protein